MTELEFKIKEIELCISHISCDTYRVTADVIGGDSNVPDVSIYILKGELAKPLDWFKSRFLKAYHKVLLKTKADAQEQAKCNALIGQVIDP